MMASLPTRRGASDRPTPGKVLTEHSSQGPGEGVRGLYEMVQGAVAISLTLILCSSHSGSVYSCLHPDMDSNLRSPCAGEWRHDGCFPLGVTFEADLKSRFW